MHHIKGDVSDKPNPATMTLASTSDAVQFPRGKRGGREAWLCAIGMACSYSNYLSWLQRRWRPCSFVFSSLTRLLYYSVVSTFLIGQLDAIMATHNCQNIAAVPQTTGHLNALEKGWCSYSAAQGPGATLCHPSRPLEEE